MELLKDYSPPPSRAPCHGQPPKKKKHHWARAAKGIWGRTYAFRCFLGNYPENMWLAKYIPHNLHVYIYMCVYRRIWVLKLRSILPSTRRFTTKVCPNMVFPRCSPKTWQWQQRNSGLAMQQRRTAATRFSGNKEAQSFSMSIQRCKSCWWYDGQCRWPSVARSSDCCFPGSKVLPSNCFQTKGI